MNVYRIAMLLLTISFTLLCSHVPDLQDTSVLDVPYFVYMSLEQYPDALRVALRMDRLRVSKLCRKKGC